MNNSAKNDRKKEACIYTAENTMCQKHRRVKSRVQVEKDRDSLKKQFRLICVFPEKTSEEEQVKSDVKKIMFSELKHQMRRL